MEVEVLRLAVLRESWQCLAEDESPSCVADTSENPPQVRCGMHAMSTRLVRL